MRRWKGEEREGREGSELAPKKEFVSRAPSSLVEIHPPQRDLSWKPTAPHDELEKSERGLTLPEQGQIDPSDLSVLAKDLLKMSLLNI